MSEQAWPDTYLQPPGKPSVFCRSSQSGISISFPLLITQIHPSIADEKKHAPTGKRRLLTCAFTNPVPVFRLFHFSSKLNGGVVLSLPLPKSPEGKPWKGSIQPTVALVLGRLPQTASSLEPGPNSNSCWLLATLPGIILEG